MGESAACSIFILQCTTSTLQPQQFPPHWIETDAIMYCFQLFFVLVLRTDRAYWPERAERLWPGRGSLWLHPVLREPQGDGWIQVLEVRILGQSLSWSEISYQVCVQFFKYQFLLKFMNFFYCNLRVFCYFSALYVVDLKKFRKIAAGDRLRGQYQGLSQDPNSLSNLDQVCGSWTGLCCEFWLRFPFISCRRCKAI